MLRPGEPMEDWQARPPESRLPAGQASCRPGRWQARRAGQEPLTAGLVKFSIAHLEGHSDIFCAPQRQIVCAARRL